MITVLPYYSVLSNPSGSRGLSHVMTTASINGLATGTTNLLTVPAGCSFVLQQAVVRLVGVTGSATVGEVKIVDSTASADLIANTTLTGLTSTGKCFPLLTTAAVMPVVPAGSVVSFTISTAFTVATAVNLSVDLIGYLV